MSKKCIGWLYNELPELMSKGIVTSDLFWPLFAAMLPHLWQEWRKNPYSERSVGLGWAVSLCLCVATGMQYRFRTVSVDPYDAFRGRYVALGIDEGTVKLETASDFYRGQKVFAVVGKDEDGFAKISGSGK